MLHTIEWRHDRRRILLPVLIIAPRPSTDLAGISVIALLDTGSTTTGLTGRIAEKLDLARRGKRPIGSIQGEGQAERFVFRVGLHIPGDEPAFPFVFNDIEGFELKPSMMFDALIGMDILHQCDLHVGRDRVCRLTFGG
jgi:Aspartyl protease